MAHICGKSPNSDFLGQTGPKKVRIYTEKSEFYHFPFIQRLFYINVQEIATQSLFNHVRQYVLLPK